MLFIAGRCAFGWAVALVFTACLLGRLRPVNWALSLDLWTPLAALSYAAYLLQYIPLGFWPNWYRAEVNTMWAAWATAGLAFLLETLTALAIALPSYFVVERPLSVIWPRAS